MARKIQQIRLSGQVVTTQITEIPARLRPGRIRSAWLRVDSQFCCPAPGKTSLYRMLSSILMVLVVCKLGFVLPGLASGQGPELGRVRMIAEWEPAVGTMITWPLKVPDELVRALAEDNQLYILVPPAEISAASRHIGSLKIDAQRVQYLPCPVESQWPRDWGPHQIFDADGEFCLVDHRFDGYPWYPRKGGEPPTVYRTGPGDDAATAEIAKALNHRIVDLPAVLTGGNFLVDGHGTAFCTQALFDENRSRVGEDELRLLLQEKLGIDRVVILENTESLGIQHIDCWLKLLDCERLLVKKAPPGHPESEALERNVAVLSRLNNALGRPYQIIRIECPEVPLPQRNGSTKPIAAYTNSLILNDRVFVPLFGIPGDDMAIQSWRDALPGYRVQGFVWDRWQDFDALHCRTRAVFDSEMLRVETWRLPAKVGISAAGYAISATIEDMSGAGLDSPECKVNFRAHGNSEWQSKAMLPLHYCHRFVAVIPAFPAGTKVEYFVTGRSKSGKVAHCPVTAPRQTDAFRIIEN